MTRATRRASYPGVSPRLTFSVLVALCLGACASTAPKSAGAPAAARSVMAVSPAEQPNALGIRVTGLRVSAGGFMVDLRYRVVDPERAKALLDKKVPAYLVEEATGMKFGVPNTAKLGRLRAGGQNNIHMDRDYGMLFGNPGSHLKPGAMVTLVAGDIEIPHLTIH